MLNGYRRKYFISADKMYRITIDTEQGYYKIGKRNNYFMKKYKIEKLVVVSSFNPFVLQFVKKMIPDILKIIYRYAGNEFMSLDAYENVVSEFKLIYSPEVMEYLRR